MTAVWRIRGGEDNGDRFVDDGVTAVGYYSIPDGRTVGQSEVARLLREAEYASPGAAASRFTSFVHELAVGDVVVMPDTPRQEVVVGIVASPYEFHGDLPAVHYRHRRRVRWIGRHDYAELPPAWADRLKHQRQTLRRFDAPDLVEHANRIERGELGRPAKDRGRTTVRRRPGATASKVPDRRTCTTCGLSHPASSFEGTDLCPSCRSER